MIYYAYSALKIYINFSNTIPVLLIVVCILSCPFDAQCSSFPFGNSSKKENTKVDDDITCPVCHGKGKVDNPEYNRKSMLSKKYITCKACNGTGLKPRKIDGRLLKTKNGATYEDYIIQDVNNDGLTIEHVRNKKLQKTTIQPQDIPRSLYMTVYKRLFIDKNNKLYDKDSVLNLNGRFQVGNFKYLTATPQKSGDACLIVLTLIHGSGGGFRNITIKSYRKSYAIKIMNAGDHDIKYGYESKFPIILTGKPKPNMYTAEMLSPPTKKQALQYFVGRLNLINQKQSVDKEKDIFAKESDGSNNH